MSNKSEQSDRLRLQQIAQQAMMDRGLLTDFSVEEILELNGINGELYENQESLHDLRSFLWCSIDNDDSKDLDQLTFAATLPSGETKIYIGIADVDAYVKKSSLLDEHAKYNSTSVYTAAQIFPMLPEGISTDLTSLNYELDRLAIVVEIVVAEDGALQSSDIYRAIIRNHAKLEYNSVAAWFEGHGPMPEMVSAVTGLAENLLLQHQVAKKLKSLRRMHGALDFETIRARPVFQKDEIKELEIEKRNSAKDLITDFMIAANSVTARYLSAKNFPSLRRVVREPRRWERIVELAKELNFVLPNEPDPKALDKFLVFAKAKDHIQFPDLSLSVIKLLGAGEYVVELPGDNSIGHFGLAVKDYVHSTAPNRRYPDLITQRLLKAAILGKPIPYEREELVLLAKHCMKSESAAQKVERQVEKSAAAILLESKIGEKFKAIITGAAQKGTWVRLIDLPVEGRLEGSFEGDDVGSRLLVQLINTDVEQGYIDFRKIRCEP